MIVELIIIVSIFIGLHYLLMNRPKDSSKEPKKLGNLRSLFGKKSCPLGQHWEHIPGDFPDIGVCVDNGKYLVKSILGDIYFTGTEKGGFCANDETCISQNCVGNYLGFAIGKCA